PFDVAIGPIAERPRFQLFRPPFGVKVHGTVGPRVFSYPNVQAGFQLFLRQIVDLECGRFLKRNWPPALKITLLGRITSRNIEWQRLIRIHPWAGSEEVAQRTPYSR